MDDSTPSTQERARAALAQVLGPLADMMIATGIPVQQAIEELKTALIDAAETRAAGPHPPTDSRISVMTGLHRKDVRRLRRGENEPDGSRSEAAGALAIARWLSDPAYRDAGGEPLPLPRRAALASPSFEGLLRSLSLDLPPASVLDEMTARGIVAWNKERDDVTLLKRAYVADGDLAERLDPWRRNLVAHLAGATANLEAGDTPAPALDLAGHYNRLSAASRDSLDRLARALLTEALETISKTALAHQDTDASDPANRERFSFGAYTHCPAPPRSVPERDRHDDV